MSDDPIADWKWRSPDDVRSHLSGLDEIPSHVAKFGDFMDETAHKASTEGLSPRDLIKAYTITRSSIQRSAVAADKVRDAGLLLPPDLKGKIRPEGAFGEWLHTPAGQRYLNAAENGDIDEDAIADAVKIMAPFGKHEKDIPDALRWAAKNLPGQEGRVSELITRARKQQSDPSEWRDQTTAMKGIGPAKSGFYASMLGRGDQPTLDARQLVVNTGQPSKAATPYLRKKGAGEAAVNRLAEQQTQLGLKHDPKYAPYYQHLAHHAVWDAAGNEQTTHDDVVKAMRGAKRGGKIEEDDSPAKLHRHAVVQAMHRAGLPKLWTPSLRDAAMLTGRSVDDALKVLARRGKDVGDKLSTLTPQSDWAEHTVLRERGNLTPEVRMDPQQLIGKTLITAPGDRLATDMYVHGMNGNVFDKPIHLPGGPLYARGKAGQSGSAWASAPGAVKAQTAAAKAALEKGSDPVHVPWSMSRGSADSAPAMWDLMLANLPFAKISKKGAALIDEGVRKFIVAKDKPAPFPDWPGIKHPKLGDWVKGKNLSERYLLMKALEKGQHIEAGLPDPAALRLAVLEPEYLTPRSLTAGRVLTNMDPTIVENPEHPHPGYPVQFKGKYAGSLARPVPLGRLFPDAWKTAAGDLDPDVKDVPNPVNRKLQLTTHSQLVTPKIADDLSHYMEQQQGQPFASGGRAGDAEQDKKLVAKAIHTHDRQMHGGKLTDLRELQKARGGSVNHSPTEAQKAAGNYAKKHITFQGIPIAIENAMGSVRSGRDHNGKPWSCKLPADYGYIKRSMGADGDQVDAYIGPDVRSNLVVVVDQHNPHQRGRFDEHKCLLGFKSEREALDCYRKGFSDGSGDRRIGAVKSMSVDAFKQWLKRGKTTKPAARQDIVAQALNLVNRQADVRT